MDRALLEQNLALAEQHVAKAEEHIRQQREIIATLERDEHDSTLARTLLTTYEQTLTMHIADRDRIRELLTSAP